MAGAIFIVDQIPGAGVGTAGVPRKDLHADKPLQLRAAFPSGINTYEWAILDKPPGSLAEFDDPSAALPIIAAPGIDGTMRVQLITNGGGPGNVTVQALAVLSNAPGLAERKRGWRVPAFGESDEENDYPDNDERGFAPAIEYIFADIEDNAFTVNDSIPFHYHGAVQAAPMAIGKGRGLLSQINFDPTIWRHLATNIQFRLDVRLYHPTADHTSDISLFKRTTPATQLGTTQTLSGFGEKSLTLNFTDYVSAGFDTGDMVYELRIGSSFQTSDPGDLASNPVAYEVPVLLARLLFRNKV